MIRSCSEDPFSGLSRHDRRSWRAAERRTRDEHEEQQLTALLGLAAAGGGVTGMRTPAGEGIDVGATPVELIIEGRRLRAARVHRRTLAKLREAMPSIAAVPLTAVGRYGPYWVLTFRLATEHLVMLADQLTLLPDWGGPGGRDPRPVGVGPAAGMGF